MRTFAKCPYNISPLYLIYVIHLPKLYDKRDGFPFFIIRMPDLSGNIPSHVFYGSVMSEFLRIARCTLLYPDFLSAIITLYRRMLNQGGSEIKLLMQIRKAFNRHPSSFSFNKSSKQIIEDIKSGCAELMNEESSSSDS